MAKNLIGCCPYCCAPIGKIFECHPFSSDAGAYFVCDVCDARFEPDEYEALLAESEEQTLLNDSEIK